MTPTSPPSAARPKSTGSSVSAAPWSGPGCGPRSTSGWPRGPAGPCTEVAVYSSVANPYAARPMSQSAGELVEVRLLRLPLHVWQRTQEHVDELLREFALI